MPEQVTTADLEDARQCLLVKPAPILHDDVEATAIRLSMMLLTPLSADTRSAMPAFLELSGVRLHGWNPWSFANFSQAFTAGCFETRDFVALLISS